MECVEGDTFPEYDEPAWLIGPPDTFRDYLCQQYVDAIAGLANLPLVQMLGPVRSGAEELALWRKKAKDAGNAQLVAMMDKLIAMGAPTSGPPGVVHGDPKLGNTLWREGRLQALLDWEMASNGDPLNDLGYMLYFFPSEGHAAQVNCGRPGMWSRERIIAEWERVTGRSAAGHKWYEAAGSAKIAAIIAYGHHLSVIGESADERMAAWGPNVEAGVAMTDKLIRSMDDG
jgi:aminoglycoside phosphotransferase (APT) family kinase protein